MRARVGIFPTSDVTATTAGIPTGSSSSRLRQPCLPPGSVTDRAGHLAIDVTIVRAGAPRTFTFEVPIR